MGGTLFTEGGHYSLVNNVRGDSIHGGTVFTPTPVDSVCRDGADTPIN